MPLEPLYTLEVACELIPCTRTSITGIIHKYQDRGISTPQYTFEGQAPRRLLTEADCLFIRSVLIKYRNEGKRGPGYGVKGLGGKPFVSRQAQDARNQRLREKIFEVLEI